MGLIKQVIGGTADIFSSQAGSVIQGGLQSVKSVLQDKFKGVIECDNMEGNILMLRKSTETGRIPKDSAIVVAPGQMAVIIDSGKVADAVAEEGVYIFDESSTPCFAAGEFQASLEEMWERFTFGGNTYKTQDVYYFNIKEIMDNGFGTKGPVPFKDWGHPVMNPRIPGGISPMSVQITCFGKYTFKIADPALFMHEIAGTANIYEKSTLTEQLQSEVIGSIQQLLNKLGTEEYKIPALDLPSAGETLKELLEEEAADKSFQKRGLKMTNVTLESVRLDETSQKKIDQYELGGDQYTQQGVMTGAYGEALVGAANNQAGAGSAMMGVGFMNMGNNMFQSARPNNAEVQQTISNQPQPHAAGGTQSVVCSCGTAISGKFCPNCGKPAPAAVFCSNCGKPVIGKFCAECGTPVNQQKSCPDCGIEVAGKFCPNCGKKVE